ncbi:MAG: hypothetical protein M5U01_38785 [Ardenticatenaceae bacterium]|nr:hypothetical protein [Ardenticatenaceae bacterium]
MSNDDAVSMAVALSGGLSIVTSRTGKDKILTAQVQEEMSILSPWATHPPRDQYG